MAAEYFLYNTLYNNTLIDRSDTSFAPLPPYGEIFIDYFIPELQPLFYYKETGSTIVINTEQEINTYLIGTSITPSEEDNVTQYEFTGYTNSNDNKINFISGITNTKLNAISFDNYSGTTEGVLDNINTNLTELFQQKLDISGGTITGTLNVNSLIQGTSLQLSQDLTVNGSMDIRHIEQIYTRGDFIYMRSGATGGLGIGEVSGFGIMDADGSGTTVVMGTDMNGIMRVGWSGDTLQALGTREDNPIDNGIGFWNETEQMFVTTGYTMNNLTTDVASKIPKVPLAETGNIAIFNGDGTIKDGGISIDEITGGTGYYFYIDRTGNQSTTSSTNVVYLSGTSEILTAGTWSIDFNAIGGNISPNKAIIVEFYIDNVLQGYPNRFKTNDSNSTMSFVVSKDLTLTNIAHTFEIRFSQAQGGTAYIEYGSIRARIVN